LQPTRHILSWAAALLLLPCAASAQAPWPAQNWYAGTDIGFGSQPDLSGAYYNATGNYVLALAQYGGIWKYTYSPILQTWVTTVPAIAPAGGDFEGLTMVDEADDPVDGARVLLLNEGTGGGHNDSYVYYVRRLFTVPSLVRVWKVGCASGCAMYGEVNDLLGPEGIAFVPNTWLAARGFRDAQGNLRLGTPTSANGLGGLVFIGHQWGGLIYVFDLKTDADHSMAFVGSYDTGTSFDEVAGLEFDRTNGLLYVFHGGGGNFLEVTDLSSSPWAGGVRIFTTLASTSPADINGGLNLEGLAVIPPDMCAANSACPAMPPPPNGSIFLTCDNCAPAIKWMSGLSGGWLAECPPGCASGPPGDVNCDGVANGSDVSRFVELVNEGDYTCQGDFDRDRDVDPADVSAFVGALLGV